MVKGSKDVLLLKAYFNYLCGCKPGFPKFVLDSEKHSIFLHLRATVAIYASLIFWIGSWNLLTEEHPYGQNGQRSFELFADGFSREACYVGVGTVLLLATDTLYGNAGLPGGFYPPSMFCTKNYAILPRAIVGLLGSSKK